MTRQLQEQFADYWIELYLIERIKHVCSARLDKMKKKIPFTPITAESRHEMRAIRSRDMAWQEYSE